MHTGRTVINLRAFGPDLADGFVQAGLPAPPGNNQWLDQVNSLYWLGPDEWLLVCPGPGDVPDGLAMAASLNGYSLICTVPDKVPVEKVALLQAHGRLAQPDARRIRSAAIAAP